MTLAKWGRTGILLGALALAAPTAAQTAQPGLDYASAATIRDTCLAWAKERKLEVAIAVYDRHGNLIAFAHMDGAAAAVGELAQWKARSAARMQFSTAVTAEWGGSAPGIANWQGGVPFSTSGGDPLGGVGVSGASSQDDEDCGRAGIAAAGLVAPVAAP